ncbi:MAG: aminodeoxychorismate lyase [Steroidobacterales bacterium]
MNVRINGRRIATIDHRDRGLQYGDGLFETMRIRRGAVRLIDYHLERLLDGCRRLNIDPPNEHRLRRELAGAAAAHTSAVLKLIVTRGVGPRGYRPSGRERSTRIVSVSALPRASVLAFDRPIRVRLCQMRLGANPRLAGLKTLNRLESVLARSEWTDPRIHEGLMRDGADRFVCGTMSNLFLRRGNLLITPLLDRCGVAGVMRRWVLEQAGSIGVTPVERRVGTRELQSAEEVFMTNAVAGPRPVAEVRLGAVRIRPPMTATALQLRALLDQL